MWVPAHLGIQGNEKADKNTKEAVRKEEVEMKVKLSKAEGKSLVLKEIINQWNQYWKDQVKGRHLFKIQSTVGGVGCCGGNRAEQVIISRLRIGHSRLNNTLSIIGKHPTGRCSCGERETVEHVMVECHGYDREREELYIGLQKARVGEKNLQSIIECGKSREGRALIIRYLVSTGLIKRI